MEVLNHMESEEEKDLSDIFSKLKEGMSAREIVKIILKIKPTKDLENAIQFHLPCGEVNVYEIYQGVENQDPPIKNMIKVYFKNIIYDADTEENVKLNPDSKIRKAELYFNEKKINKKE